MIRLPCVVMTAAEVQSGLDRVALAELLILQLPAGHDGRNTWLLNYGRKDEAVALRAAMGVKFDPLTEAAHTIKSKT